MVVIAHRPSALAGVDMVLMMNQGRAQSFGPKDEILSKVLRPQVPDPSALRIRSRREEIIMTSGSTSPVGASIRRHLAVGAAVALFLVGGVGTWASTTDISGAVIASGNVVVDLNLRKVQHPTGGIVSELRVRDGDHVREGDVLVRLDETLTRANLAIVDKSLSELLARKARLEAERDAIDGIAFPDELLSRSEDLKVAHVIDGERRLFQICREARVGQRRSLTSGSSS